MHVPPDENTKISIKFPSEEPYKLSKVTFPSRGRPQFKAVICTNLGEKYRGYMSNVCQTRIILSINFLKF